MKLKLILYGLAVLAIGFSIYQWVQERDARIKAELTEQHSEQVIADLHGQIAQRHVMAKKKVQAVIVRQKDVHTPQQAIAAMPDVSSLPVTSFRPLPSGDVEISAEAVIPLFNELAEGKKCSIELEACRGDLADMTKVTKELETEKTAWKRAAGKRSFLGKVMVGVKAAALVAAGIAIGKVL